MSIISECNNLGGSAIGFQTEKQDASLAAGFDCSTLPHREPGLEDRYDDEDWEDILPSKETQRSDYVKRKRLRHRAKKRAAKRLQKQSSFVPQTLKEHAKIFRMKYNALRFCVQMPDRLARSIAKKKVIVLSPRDYAVIAATRAHRHHRLHNTPAGKEILAKQQKKRDDLIAKAKAKHAENSDSELDPQGRFFDKIKSRVETLQQVTRAADELDTFKEQLAYKGTEPAELLSNLASRTEDLTMLLAGLASAENFTSVFTTLFFYLRTHYKESVSSKLYAWIKEAMFRDIVPIAPDPFGAGSIRSKLNHQGIYDDLKSTIQDFDTLGGIESFRGLINNWREFKSCSLGTNVANVVNILVTVGFFPDLLENPIKLGIFEIFKAKAWDMQKNSTSFTDMCFDTLDFFLSRAYHAISAGDPSIFFYGSEEEHSFETEYTTLISCLPAIEADRLSDLQKYSCDIQDEADFDFRLQQLISRTIKMLKAETAPPRKTVLAGYLARLRQAAVALTLSQKNSCVREKPYGMLVHGASSVGKTMVVNILMKTALASNGFASDKEYVVTIKDNENFDTDQQPYHTGWIFDDYGNTRAEHYSEAPTRLIIDVLNNIPRSLRKADIESKGNKMMKPKVVGVTTNIKNLHSDKFSVEPVSILRRFELILDVHVKPEYCDPLTGGIDGTKMQGWCPDAWDIDVQRVKIIRKTKENGLMQDKYQFETILSQVGIQEVREYVKAQSKTHFVHQKRFVEAVEEMYEMKFCLHGDPQMECRQCMRIIAPAALTECDTANGCVYHEGVGLGREVQAEISDECSEMGNSEITRGGNWTHEHDPPPPDDASDYEAVEEVSVYTAVDRELVDGRLTTRLRHVTRDEVPGSTLTHEAQLRYNHALKHQGAYDEPEVDVIPQKNSLFNFFNKTESEHDALCQLAEDEDGDWESLNDANKYICDDVMSAAIVTCGCVGSVYLLWQAIKLMRGLSKVNPQGSAVSVPVPIDSDRPNPWKIVQPVKIPKSEASENITIDELSALVSRHIAHATFTYVDSFGVTHRGSCDAVPMCGNTWVVPAHMLNKSKELMINVKRVNTDTVGYRFYQAIDESSWVELPNDLALVRLTAGGSVPDLCKFLAEGNFELTDKLFCDIVHRAETCEISRDTVLIDSKQTFTTDQEFEGVSYKYPRPTFAGLCCATLITRQRKPCILGFHVAGRTGENFGVASLITHGDVLKGLSDLNSKMPLISHSQGDMPTCKYDIDYTPTDTIHPKHCVNFLSEDADGDLPAVDTYGAHAGGSVKFLSQVRKSPISDTVEEVLGLPRIHGAPQKGPSYVHWQRDLQAMSHPKGGKMKPNLLNRAFKDLRGTFRDYINEHPEKKELVHPYAKDAVLSGVDGVASVEKVDVNTSMGFPINKAKKYFLGPVERKVDGISVVYDFEDPKYWEEVERMEQELAAGKRVHVIFRGNLKDEPVKFDKNKIRVFTGCEFAFTCLVRKYFLPIVRLIQDSEGLLECAVGINATSPQWDKFVKRLTKHGTERMIAGDYKQYDKNISIQMMMYAFEILIDVAEQCGYTQEQITVMRGIATEISNPLYEYDGIFIQMLGSNPSGHPLTVIINNIVNSLYLRYAYYSMHTKAGDVIIPRFDVNIVLSCYGDDNAAGVSKNERLFNHTTLAQELAEIGITYTMADKGSESVPFLPLSEISFLKRKFRYDEDIGMYLAPIEENSIAKFLHNYRKTKGTDVLPSTIAAQALKGASREYFQWGRETFEKRTQQLKEVADTTGIRAVCGTFPTWEDLREEYLDAGQKRRMEQEPSVPNYNLEPYDWYTDTSLLSQQGAYALLDHTPLDVVIHPNNRDAVKLSRSRMSDIRLGNLTEEDGQGSASTAQQSSAVLDKPLEMDFSTGNPVKNQNVQFRDDDTGFGDTRGSPFDKIRDDAMIQDATLDQFFARPVKIFSHQWNVNGYFNFDIDPWTTYWENPRVLARISNYRLLRATMRVKFVINGNAFYYGRVLANYRPLPLDDTLTTERPLQLVDLVGASQRPHIFLDPCTNQGGELELPFFTPDNVLDIVNRDWRSMGKITMQSINDLKHANGAVDPITINVFAWAENVSFSVPTQTEPGQLAPGRLNLKQPLGLVHQGKDEVLGIVSKPASVVAKTAALFTSIPTIGPFARATEIGARAIGSMAALFGYSKPTQVVATPFQPTTKSSLALCDGAEPLNRLTVDSKNELSIDPGISGIKAKDELTILNIATRESYYTTFSWQLPPTKTSEDLLWNCIVDPGIHRTLTTFVGQSPEIHMPACCFATLPFQYWKGSMRFRFQIVASGYHKGRLKFVYDPIGTGFVFGGDPNVASAEYNTAYTTVVDITETTDFTIDVGWGQKTPFRETIAASGATFDSTTRLVYNSIGSKDGNGTLAVYVVNDLTSPDSTIDNDIQINVFVSMLDDFELAGPTSLFIKNLHTYLPPELTPPPLRQQGEYESVPTDPMTVAMMGKESTVDDTMNRIYFGEAIASYRTLLKRYCLHECISLENNDFNFPEWMVNAKMTRHSFPHEVGYTPDSNGFGYPTIAPFTSDYVLGYTPLISYITSAYMGWRGSIRYLWDASFSMDFLVDSDAGFPNKNSFTVSRIPAEIPYAIENSIVPFGGGTVDTFSNVSAMLEGAKDVSGLDGISRWHTQVNPFHTFEVPYYSNKRFTVARKHTTFTAESTEQKYQVAGCFPLGSGKASPYILQTHVAAGEDFQPMFYIGPPIMYYYENPIIS